jgi:Tfp pilus assembly protein PilF
MKGGFHSSAVALLILVAPAWAGGEASRTGLAPEAALVIVTSRSFGMARAGNGFVIGDGTLVVTCDHLVTEESRLGEHRMEAFVTVFSPYLGEACDARIVASDHKLDLAVLEVPWPGHPALSLADANAVTSAHCARVVGLAATLRGLDEGNTPDAEHAVFPVDREELPIAYIGIRDHEPRLVAMEGVGRLGAGWSGSPILLPDSSVALGCFASVSGVSLGGQSLAQEAKGPAVSGVPALLGEAFRDRAAGPGPARRTSPNDAREVCALALRAVNLVQREQYASAQEAARTLVQHRPDSALAHKMLACASEHLGQVEAAREEYQRALQLDPNDVRAQLLYAQFLGTRGEPNAARQVLEPLWRSGRARDVVAIALVNLQSEQKEFSRCLEILEEATRFNPRNAYLWQQTAGCRMQAQGRAAAVEPLTRAVELYPERGPFRGSLAHLLEATGDLDGAEKHFRQLLEVEPDNPVVYCWLAQFLLKHRPQAIEEARKTAEKALSLPPRPSLPRATIEQLLAEIRARAEPNAQE